MDDADYASATSYSIPHPTTSLAAFVAPVTPVAAVVAAPVAPAAPVGLMDPAWARRLVGPGVPVACIATQLSGQRGLSRATSPPCSAHPTPRES